MNMQVGARKYLNMHLKGIKRCKMADLNELEIKIIVDSDEAIKKLDEIIEKIRELGEAFRDLFSVKVNEGLGAKF